MRNKKISLILFVAVLLVSVILNMSLSVFSFTQSIKGEGPVKAIDELVISSMEKISNFLMMTILMGSLVGLSLIFSYGVRSRSYEIGVLLSIGKSKGYILMSFIALVLVLNMIAMVISVVPTARLADQFNDARLLKYTKESAHSIEANEKGLGGEESELALRHESHSLSLKNMVLLFASSSLLLALSVTLGALPILRKPPKAIMTSVS